jgi:type I restriction enzyme, S subunit
MRSEHIQQLRHTILNLAVRGLLVRQDVNDEPAPSFGISRDTDREDRVNITLPESWTWAKVEDVAEARLGKMLDKAKNSGKPFRYLRNTNVHWFDIRIDELKDLRISDAEIEKYLLRVGDVLICEGGHGIGRTAVWRSSEKDIIFQKALHRVRPGVALNSDFFSYCMFVYFHAKVLQTYFTGVGIPHFTGKALSVLVFPLPPFAEQLRIVAKVDELMAVCDQLEAQLATTKTESRRLLEAVLHHALNDSRISEPAFDACIEGRAGVGANSQELL